MAGKAHLVENSSRFPVGMIRRHLRNSQDKFGWDFTDVDRPAVGTIDGLVRRIKGVVVVDHAHLPRFSPEARRCVGCRSMTNAGAILPAGRRDAPDQPRSAVPRLAPMAILVAVVDPLPMYRQGVAAVLSEAGHSVDTPDDVLAWVRRPQPTVVLLTLESEPAWEVLRRLHDTSTQQVVIALVEEQDPGLGAKAVQAGARSVLPRTVSAATLRHAVDATIDGLSVLPATVVSALAAGVPAAGDTASGAGRSPLPNQLSWLRHLAAGSTVGRLASQVGYSERAMFRQLRDLYQQMGVSNRTEAILRAQESGWLTPPTVDG